MRFADIEKKVIVVFGVVLAILIPIIVKVFGHIIPIELILAMILIYLAYIVGSLINTEEGILQNMEELGRRVTGTGVEIIGSNQLHRIKESVEENKGDVWFFNVPLGRIRTQEGFDAFVKPGIENPHTRNITFILNKSVKDIWEEHVRPKISKVKGGDKTVSVRWMDDEKRIGFMLLKASEEVYLITWEEPFLVETPKGHQTMMMFHTTHNHEFFAKLEEIFEKHLLSSEP
jgi:hypothetical protein